VKQTVYGMEAVRMIMMWPICAIRGHRWLPTGFRCERCGYVNEDLFRRAVVGLKSLERLFKSYGQTVAEATASIHDFAAAMEKAKIAARSSKPYVWGAEDR